MKDELIIDNIYKGNETTVKCMVAFYELLMAGKMVTPNMIMARIDGKPLDYYDGKNLEDDLPDRLNKYRKQQKKIMTPMVRTINKFAEVSVEKVHIGGHCHAFVYKGTDKDPLRHMKMSAVKKEIEDFRQFCYDSSGFFPQSWLEHFFKNTQELLDLKQAREGGGALMSVSLDRKLDNIDLLPLLYEKIRDRKVIAFDYNRGFESTPTRRTVHPHFLHEFNGRWHLFGYEREGDMDPANVSVDRIVKENGIEEVQNVEYVAAEPGFYDGYFKHLVGVTHGIPPFTGDWRDSKPEKVRVRAYTEYIYGLTRSKAIHDSQKPIGAYNKECGYGDFELYVELNNEFIGRVMQYGPHLEIISPENYRREFVERVKKMAKNYGIAEI